VGLRVVASDRTAGRQEHHDIPFIESKVHLTSHIELPDPATIKLFDICSVRTVCLQHLQIEQARSFGAEISPLDSAQSRRWQRHQLSELG